MDVLWVVQALLLALVMTLPSPGSSSCPAECSCRGNWVTCNSMNLTSVPAGIANRCTLLDLTENQLVTLPAGAFSNLTQLDSLILKDNQLSSIDVEAFANLHVLGVLDLARNKISSLSPGVFNGIGNLQALLLEGNHLTTVPSGVFANLPYLINLKMGDNRFTAVPAFLQEVPGLLSLRMNGNEILSLPLWVCEKMTQLDYLDISDNQLTSLPAEIGHLSNLWALVMNGNNLTSLPAAALLKLNKLKNLFIKGNAWELREILCVLHHHLARGVYIQLDRNILKEYGALASGLSCFMSTSVCFLYQPSQKLYCPCKSRENVYNGFECSPRTTCANSTASVCYASAECTVQDHINFCNCSRGTFFNYSCVVRLPTTAPKLSYVATSTSLQLSWDNLTAAEINGRFIGYYVYFRPANRSGNHSDYHRNLTTENHHTVNGLSPSTVWQVRLSVVNGDGNGPLGKVLKVATLPRKWIVTLDTGHKEPANSSSVGNLSARLRSLPVTYAVGAVAGAFVLALVAFLFSKSKVGAALRDLSAAMANTATYGTSGGYEPVLAKSRPGDEA